MDCRVKGALTEVRDREAIAPDVKAMIMEAVLTVRATNRIFAAREATKRMLADPAIVAGFRRISGVVNNQVRDDETRWRDPWRAFLCVG